ncbi:hypothetical protein LCGC14_1641220 [marine sediment metagenome]|uniref:SAP domain-containing protein n=1 Tax=marine sediment metagenome TaxID=412755 RepID=A0A0F9KFD7_9ZZZZ
MNRTQVTITNRNRAVVRSIGRRFRPGIPRSLNLADNQLNVVRGNPWLWIEGEDWDGEDEPVDLEAFHDVELRELAFFLEIPGARKASRTELIESIEEVRAEVAVELGDAEAKAYEDWSANELKDALRERELPVSGNKPELIERLEESDVEDEPEDETDDDVGEED